MILQKVISGGQTGADLGGLIAAKEFGILTGGYMTQGYRNHLGSNPSFARDYGMQEWPSGKYKDRTYANVRESCGTIRFATDFYSAGEICTLNAIQEYKKPFIDVSVPYDVVYNRNQFNSGLDDIVIWFKEHDISVLNVAGNSEKTAQGIQIFVSEFLLDFFATLKLANLA